MDPNLIKKVKRRDKIARTFIITGGIMILCCVVGILLLIAKVSLPLFYSPTIELHSEFKLDLPTNSEFLSIATDEYLENGFVVQKDGVVTFFDIAQKKIGESKKISPPKKSKNATVEYVEVFEKSLVSIFWSDLSSTLDKISFEAKFDKQNQRQIFPKITRLGELKKGRKLKEAPLLSSTRLDENNELTRVSLSKDKQIYLTQQINVKNVFGKVKPKYFSTILKEKIPGEVTTFVLDKEGKKLFVGTSKGYLLNWELNKSKKKPKKPLLVDRLKYSKGSITAATMLLGDFSLAIGDSLGNISTCFPLLLGQTGRFPFDKNTYNLLKENKFPKTLWKEAVAFFTSEFHFPMNEEEALDIVVEANAENESWLLKNKTRNRNYVISIDKKSNEFVMRIEKDSVAQRELVNAHTLKSHKSEVKKILPSYRERSLVSLSKGNVLHLDHMTTENHFFELSPKDEVLLANYSYRGDAIIVLDKKNQISVWELEVPHPEISFSSLFGKVWYESYQKPEYVWQSSSGSDDFEPKIGLVPLIYGSVKGTFYAMIFAVPLALLGAIYTSQFLNPNLRQVVKPAIETMASIPSVILGFMAALWLAPLVEDSILGVLFCLVLIPLFGFLNIFLWPLCKKHKYLGKFMNRIDHGYEFLFVIPGILLGAFLSLKLGTWCEIQYFESDFKLWLFQNLSINYDQRNCIIIAFGLGFAVIPIIFTISEDAISNVPRSIVAASLALGASRWQTLWRVILPSASSGIFAGVIIGFGRAIGETMIVLMATGNTPIMGMSPFNGMRTLSANIAVEIPEAPVGGTLYRVLFLSAVILFLLTFVLNTFAEIIRQRLRKKYGRI